jgi:hypothetical protein
MRCPVANSEIRSLNDRLGSLLTILCVALTSSACGPIWLMTTCARQRRKEKCSLFPLLLPIVWALAVRVPMTFFVFCKFRTFRSGGNRPHDVLRDLACCWNQFKCIVSQQVPSILLAITVVLEKFALHYGERSNWLGFSVFAWMLSIDILVLSKAVIVMWTMREQVSVVQRFLQEKQALEQQQLIKIEDMCKRLASFEYQERKPNCEAQICSGDTCDLALHKSLHLLSWFNDQVTCTVCLSEFSQKDVVLHPSCGHLFHRTCFAQWMSTRMSHKTDEPSMLAPMCPFGCRLQSKPASEITERGYDTMVTFEHADVPEECDNELCMAIGARTVLPQDAVIVALVGSSDTFCARM